MNQKVKFTLSIAKITMEKIKKNAAAKGLTYSAYVTTLVNQDKNV